MSRDSSVCVHTYGISMACVCVRILSEADTNTMKVQPAWFPTDCNLNRYPFTMHFCECYMHS